MKVVLIGGPADGSEVEATGSPLIVPYFDDDLAIVTDYGTALAVKNAQYTRERWVAIEPVVTTTDGDYRNGGKLLKEVVEPAMKDVPGYTLSHLDHLLPPFITAWKIEVTLWLCDSGRKDAIADQGEVAMRALFDYLAAMCIQRHDLGWASRTKQVRRAARAEWHRLAWLMSPTDKEGTPE